MLNGTNTTNEKNIYILLTNIIFLQERSWLQYKEEEKLIYTREFNRVYIRSL